MHSARDFAIVAFSQDHAESLRELIESLDDWFEPTVWEDVREAAGPDSTLLAVSASGRVVGFVEVAQVGEADGRITWAGVAPDWQRQGVGTALMETVMDEATAAGLERLWVETVSGHVPYAPFDRTRNFYAKLGFTPAVELGDYTKTGLDTTDWRLDLPADDAREPQSDTPACAAVTGE